MPGLALDPDDGRIRVGAANDAQDGFIAVGGIFDGDEEGGLFALGDGAPALGEVVGGVGGGGKGVVERCKVLGG